MRLFVAIISSQKDENEGNNQAIRDTWLKGSVPFDYRFFVGDVGQLSVPDDTIKLAVPDDYEHLPHKTKGIANYVIDGGYDFLYKCDRDTYVVPNRLMKTGFENHQYFGHFPGHPVEVTHQFEPNEAGNYGYASGGCGYFLSRPSVYHVAKAEVTDWAEDRWVGDTMGRARIPGTHNHHLFWFKYIEWMDGEVASIHLSTGPGNYNKERMYAMHRLAACYSYR